MTKNLKKKGITFEREIVNLHKSKGYHAGRFAASIGTFDVLCWNIEHMKFIQAKVEKNKTCYKQDIERMKKEVVPPNSIKELWIKRDRKGITIKVIS